MYSILFTPKADKQIERLEKKTSARIMATLERIRIRPYHFIVRLVGSPFYRLRVGRYRVILDIRDKELIILVIELGDRKEIYK